jgi:hypothetical protein
MTRLVATAMRMVALIAAVAVRSAFAGTANGDASQEASAAAGNGRFSREEASYFSDLLALTSGAHRLSGSDEGRRAAELLQVRLADLGVNDVFVLDMPVRQMRTLKCDLTFDGVHVALHAMRPNVTVLPSTAAGGIVGHLVYAKRGEPEEFGARDVSGAIVLLDYDSGHGWERAFAFGAAAVVFVGQGSETPIIPKLSGVPVNQPRFYVAKESLQGIDWTRDRDIAVLDSQVVWEQKTGRNIVARIRGSDPGFAPERHEPEALVLAANYDSFGDVPELCPAARGAANVASLLEAAWQLRTHPVKRDIWLMFLDNQAHYHQGAREVYDALEMSEEQHKQLAAQHAAEQESMDAMRELLKQRGLMLRGAPGSSATITDLKRVLAEEANFRRDDERKVSQKIHLSTAAQGTKSQDSTEKQAEIAERRALLWDDIRRAFHRDTLETFVNRQQDLAANKNQRQAREYLELIEALKERTLDRLTARIEDLSRVVARDRQRELLRQGLGYVVNGSRQIPWVILHVSFNFSDLGPSWGAVAGDWTNQFFDWRTPRSDGDNPGYHGRILNTLLESAESSSELPDLDRHSLSDTTLGSTFAAGAFVSSGSIAGSYGIYNLTLMSGYDARARDGYPADSLAALNWGAIRRQAAQSLRLLEMAADNTGLSQPAVFKALAKSKYPAYSSGQTTGDYAALQVSGSLKEDRPAAGALMALWPGNIAWTTQAWMSLQHALTAAYYDPLALEPVDPTGHFRVIGLREDMFSELMTFGTLCDERGRVIAVSNQDKQTQRLTDAMRVNLFSADSYSWTTLDAAETRPARLRVLSASSDASFRANRALWGQLDNQGFCYVSDQTVNYRLKLFQPMGVAALGEFTDQYPSGNGLNPAAIAAGARLGERTANDLWTLNEARLRRLRVRGVTSADLEVLHSRANGALREARTLSSMASREAGFARSAALSQHVYLPLRTAMDDLVHAIVILLLLAIPFAFAIERLTLCATTVYGKIGGFSVAFLVTFALLYWMHPGFSIAATPAIVFLAFAIVLLSSLVTYIVIRKFKVELKAMQGQGPNVHSLQISRTGTLLAAVGMGLSTMRRRRTRTTLTAITVVMLTFTILSFASFTRAVGVREVYQGPANQHSRERLFLRKLDYSPIRWAVLDMLYGQEGPGGLLSPQYWLLRSANGTERISMARSEAPSQALVVDAVMGLTAEEVSRSPELAEALGGGTSEDITAALGRGEVFVPAIALRLLKLKVGDRLLLNGHKVRLAGALNAAAADRLQHLDGQSIMPVNFQDAAASVSASGSEAAQKDENQSIMSGEAEQSFIHLSSDQVVVGSSELVQSMGGKLHAISVYPGAGIDPSVVGQQWAQWVVMPVWTASRDGVRRLVFTVLTEVSGGLGLVIPLLLGGLIIFGTLLGSISDREREIYTFSALGLSPGHVGALFFAEAAVYAVVGGMGGQLLAQGVGLVQSSLSRAGMIHPTSINYSSTNSLFAMAVVMATVLISAIYPALRASRSANPGLARSWKLPETDGNTMNLMFPFTVSSFDITGALSFLAEHFRHHDDAGFGDFAATNVRLTKNLQGNLALEADVALAPFDLGVTQNMTLTAIPSEISGVDEVSVVIARHSGTRGDWLRANRVFLKDLRQQFLLWRTLSSEVIESYRMRTLQELTISNSHSQEATVAS